MAAKTRLFYLDFIRAIATVAIVLTHFNARYLLMQPAMPEKAILTTTVGNVYIGDWGVALFFIISGASLMYVYENKLELKNFYIKRAMSIYPMFWIAYIGATIYLRYVNGCFQGGGVPKWRLILSVIGMDGFALTNGFPSFYMLGEWFLGTIIMVYALFPLLRMGVKKNLPITAAVVIVLYAAGIVICKHYFPWVVRATLPTTVLPLILFGMVFVKYKWKVHWSVALVSLLIFVGNTILKPVVPQEMGALYIGIASFFILTYLSYWLDKKPVQKICSFVGKYSYAIFLVHHVIIAQFMSREDLVNISRMRNYYMFAMIFLFTLAAAFVLYHVHKEIMGWLKQWPAKHCKNVTSSVK